MRAMRIPCFVLLVLLALSLANGAATARHCGEWTALLDAADAAAAQEQLAQADRELSTLQADWDRCQIWLRITASHDVVDEADALLKQARLMDVLHEGTHMRAALSELRELLARVDGDQRCSWSNIM